MKVFKKSIKQMFFTRIIKICKNNNTVIMIITINIVKYDSTFSISRISSLE